jgi:dienelactone hydrolase
LTIRTRAVDVAIANARFEGLLAWDDANSDPRPGIMVCHTIRGRTEFEDQKAMALAELGYVGLSVDLYGVETRGSDIDTFRDLMMGLQNDRPALQSQLQIWLEVIRKQAEVDAANIAAIGFCFGGLCVLDIARSGADVRGVASFHGIFAPPGNTAGNRIRSKVLAMHGWEDPLATPEQVEGLATELTDMGADWQIHAYGNTLHAFTNPVANDKDAGTVYNMNADRRSWVAMQNFLEELF